MTELILDEYNMRALPPRERLNKVKDIFARNEQDESLRWDAVWIAGEIAEGIVDADRRNDPMFAEIADLMVWILFNDDNGVVKHEAAFQIGLRNMRDKIPDLVHCITDKNEKALVKHEALEALSLMRVHECKDLLMFMAEDSNDVVSETAIIVLKRLDRLKTMGDFKGEGIL
jgi:hypothetical protein